jgi:hypothetical protein
MLTIIKIPWVIQQSELLIVLDANVCQNAEVRGAHPITQHIHKAATPAVSDLEAVGGGKGLGSDGVGDRARR